MEDAVARVLDAIGFEVTSIGGNGEPDGKAEAFLGYDENGKSRGYSLTYDAKSTAKSRIAAGTAHLSGLKRHQEKYKADYCMEVAIDYQGAKNGTVAKAYAEFTREVLKCGEKQRNKYESSLSR